MSGGLARGLGLRLGGAATHLSLGARGRHLEAGRVHGHKAHAARVDGTVYEERVAWLGVGLGVGVGLGLGLGLGIGLAFAFGSCMTSVEKPSRLHMSISCLAVRTCQG